MYRWNRARRLLIVLLASVFTVTATRELKAGHEAPDFVHEVRPILQARCLSCHAGVRRRGGLSFVQRNDALAPAASGVPSIVPGEPNQSELFRRIISRDPNERMPADGEPLPAGEIETLRRWIEAGAPWPGHWSFTPVRHAERPAVGNEGWVRNPIDRFVLNRLEAAGVEPAAEADRFTLVRRLYLDLLGLPPAPAAAESFLADASPDACERLVDRLLASPHFGERWGRHWLDLARYADTDGYEVDGARPNAWYWRDWVIRAVNEDQPFDEFTIEQLAGDLLDGATPDQHLATALHRQTLTNKEGGADQEEYRVEALIDRVHTTATVWLGLTVACAQCHDHPYDPVRQREFYQLFAFFNNADEAQFRLPTDSDAEYRRQKAEHDAALKSARELLETAAESERARLKRWLRELEKMMPNDPAVQLDVIAQREEPRTTCVLHRGNFLQPNTDEVVEPGGLAALPPLKTRCCNGPADRLDLARWLVDPANPLTARVTVNRVWQHLFGAGLVRTPDDFGATGEPPTHPELLDWLADEFIRSGWSRKRLIRMIVTSATYRQSSAHRPVLAQIDPQNRLLHRQNRFRVEAEIVRDLHLAASGLLASRIGGPSVFPPFPEGLAQLDFRSDLKWETSTGLDRYRRGMYTFFKRTLPDPNLTTFDCPMAETTTVRRATSNTPLQALATLNNEVFVEAAQAFAGRILDADCANDEERIALAYRLCVARRPTEREAARLLDVVGAYRAWYTRHPEQAQEAVGAIAGEFDAIEAAVWMATASIVLNLDEFITRE